MVAGQGRRFRIKVICFISGNNVALLLIVAQRGGEVGGYANSCGCERRPYGGSE